MMNEFFKNFWFNVKRTYLDTLALVLIIVGINYLPPLESGIMTLALAKLLFVSAGILHAHITRKVMWPYIDFNKDTDLVKKVMIIAWYVVIILGWTRGG
jgi:hypothetical protein